MPTASTTTPTRRSDTEESVTTPSGRWPGGGFGGGSGDPVRAVSDPDVSHDGFLLHWGRTGAGRGTRKRARTRLLALRLRQPAACLGAGPVVFATPSRDGCARSTRWVLSVLSMDPCAVCGQKVSKFVDLGRGGILSTLGPVWCGQVSEGPVPRWDCRVGSCRYHRDRRARRYHRRSASDRLHVEGVDPWPCGTASHRRRRSRCAVRARLVVG